MPKKPQTSSSDRLLPKHNRREFIKLASLATAAIGFPTIIPARVLGKDAPSNRITMAGIGLGGQGRSNMSNFLRPGVQWLAVCDVDKKNLGRAQRQVNNYYGNKDCDAYADLRDIIARDDIDAVSIATPDHWHAWAAVHAARKGMDIFGEKPLAHDIREGRAICNAVEQYGRIWQTGSWQRSVDNFHHASELVRNGRIGKVAHVEIGLPDGSVGPEQSVLPIPPELDWDMWLGPAPWQPYRGVSHWDWRWVLEWGGGQLNDWIGHHCDIALWALGLDHTGPVEISGVGKFPNKGVFNAAIDYTVDCRFETGVTMKITNQSNLEHGMGTRWIGEDGRWIHVGRGRQSSNPKNIWDDIIGAGEVRLQKSRNHFGNFLDSVKSRVPTITPAEVAQRAFSVGYLGTVAMQLGRPIKWNPDTEQVIGDETANAMMGRTPRQPWSLT